MSVDETTPDTGLKCSLCDDSAIAYTEAGVLLCPSHAEPFATADEIAALVEAWRRSLEAKDCCGTHHVSQHDDKIAESEVSS
jgi:hypothetical protein